MLANIYEAGQFSSVEALSSFTVAIILWMGGGEVIHHLIGLGTLVAFIQYAQMFFTPLRDVSSKYTTLQSALAAVERLEALMETPVTIASPALPQRVTDGRGAIVFDRVSFEYRKGEPVLRDLSFRVERGTEDRDRRADRFGQNHHHQAAQPLLRRYLRADPGRRQSMCANGTSRDLRRAIGLVQQDVFLFAGDIAENVRLGRADFSDRELTDALTRSQAHAFRRTDARRNHEEIRERGANLSTGQRQLFSFARALAYDPRILVMDEATSSVDSETERLIQIALDQLLDRPHRAGHRPSPLDHRARRSHPGSEQRRSARKRHA